MRFQSRSFFSAYQSPPQMTSNYVSHKSSYTVGKVWLWGLFLQAKWDFLSASNSDSSPFSLSVYMDSPGLQCFIWQSVALSWHAERGLKCCSFPPVSWGHSLTLPLGLLQLLCGLFPSHLAPSFIYLHLFFFPVGVGCWVLYGLCIGSCVGRCRWEQKKFNPDIVLQESPILTFQTGSHSKWGAHQEGLAGCGEPFSLSPGEGLCGFWGPELRSPWLQDKCFPH